MAKDKKSKDKKDKKEDKKDKKEDKKDKKEDKKDKKEDKKDKKKDKDVKADTGGDAPKKEKKPKEEYGDEYADDVPKPEPKIEPKKPKGKPDQKSPAKDRKTKPADKTAPDRDEGPGDDVEIRDEGPLGRQGTRADFEAPKYIKNPAALPLQELMKGFITQLKTWRNVNANNMDNDEDRFSEVMMQISREQLNRLAIHDVTETDNRQTPKIEQCAQPERNEKFPPVTLPSAELQKRRLRNSLSNPAMPRNQDPEIAAQQNTWTVTDHMREQVATWPHMHPLLKPAKKMAPKINDRIRRGLTEAFCYFARADVNYDLNKSPAWTSPKQWAMFLRAFSVSEITGISMDDLVQYFSPKKYPASFADFVTCMSLIAKSVLEIFYGTELFYGSEAFNSSSVRCRDEPDAYALYRFTELFGFHDEQATFRKYLRGREKVGTKGGDTV